MNKLETVQRRALLGASLMMSGVLVAILIYWVGVTKGSLPSPARSLVARPAAASSNAVPASPMLAATLPPPQPDEPSRPRAEIDRPPDRSGTKQPEPGAGDVSPPAATPTPKAAITNATAPVMPALTSREPTAKDREVARHWLENTNARPVLSVRYESADIARLATELGRGLLVAGAGTTNRREVFLQASATRAPSFSPFTESVARQFSNYSLTLRPAPAFAPFTRALDAYLLAPDFDLAFIPDRDLATRIFSQIAGVMSSLPPDLRGPAKVVFAGRLGIRQDQPVFEVLTVEVGASRLSVQPAQAGNPQ